MLKIRWPVQHPVPDKVTRQRLNGMRELGVLTDMAFFADSRLYHCHKVIIASASNFLRGLIETASKDNVNLLVITIGDVPVSCMVNLFEYLYFGVVLLDQQNFNILQQLTEKLDIKFIVDGMHNANFSNINRNNALEAQSSSSFDLTPSSEYIWLAGAKINFLDNDSKYCERSRKLLSDARASVPKIWVKSVKLEWYLDCIKAALELSENGTNAFPDCAKLWMLHGQILEKEGRLHDAKSVYTMGMYKCPNSVPLWILLSNVEEKLGELLAARSSMEKARHAIPKNDRLWLSSIQLELRAGLKNIADGLLVEALQECPTSGLLWSEAIFMEENKAQRKSINLDALKNCERDPHVTLAVAKWLWTEKDIRKSRQWFNRTVKMDPKFGDGWAYFYKFEVLNGTNQSSKEIMDRCVLAEPRFGEAWCKVSKDIKNWRKKTKEILLIVSTSVPIPI